MRALAGVLAVAALAVPAAAQGAAPARSYSGTSAIETDVAFKVSSGQVRGFAIGYVASCDNGETLRGTFRFKPTPLDKGRFSVRGPSTGKLADGRTTASQLRLSGSVSRKRASGTFSITTQMARLDGAGVATCRSGKVTWKATR